MLFEWDESKRQANLAKHFVDFQEATQIFDGPVFEKARRRNGEDRVLAIGLDARQTLADYFGQEGTSR